MAWISLQFVKFSGPPCVAENTKYRVFSRNFCKVLISTLLHILSADLYYQRDHSNPNVSNATSKLISQMDRFQSDILDQIAKGNDAQPKYELPKINRIFFS